MTATGNVLAFAHIGDLHLTDARQKNYHDFLSIAAQIETGAGAALDFVVLPGDNADNGLPAQYALAATALKMISAPVHIISGDHDMEQGGLDAFYKTLGAEPLPMALTARGTRCLFLDISGPGRGGPDFRLGSAQLDWLTRELDQAKLRGEPSLIFMHSYPADLKKHHEAKALNALLAAHDVALVDIGHTHYNELANDGRTIFAATRSTGQIEEGPPGYSIATFDSGVVSWRFKPIEEPFPFIMITAPADHRLLREGVTAPEGSCEIRVMALGQRAIRTVECQVDGGAWTPMTRAADPRLWTVTATLPRAALATIAVRATDDTGRPGLHAISAATSLYKSPAHKRDGSDADAIGAWPENGVMGTQLGPNRNGKPS